MTLLARATPLALERQPEWVRRARENRLPVKVAGPIADATQGPRRGAGVIADATQSLVRRGWAA